MASKQEQLNGRLVKQCALHSAKRMLLTTTIRKCAVHPLQSWVSGLIVSGCRPVSFVQEEDVATSAVPDVTVEAPAAATHFSPGPPHRYPNTVGNDIEQDQASVSDDDNMSDSGRSWSDLLQALEAHMSRHEALEAALFRHHEAVAHCKGHFEALQQWAQSRWGFRGATTGRVASEPHTGPSAQAHVPFQRYSSPHTASPRHHADASTPLHATADQHAARVENHLSGVAERSPVSVLVAEEVAQEPEDAQEPEEQPAAGRGNRFQSSEEGRSTISAQLAGLRRKANLQERV